MYSPQQAHETGADVTMFILQLRKIKVQKDLPKATPCVAEFLTQAMLPKVTYK